MLIEHDEERSVEKWFLRRERHEGRISFMRMNGYLHVTFVVIGHEIFLQSSLAAGLRSNDQEQCATNRCGARIARRLKVSNGIGTSRFDFVRHDIIYECTKTRASRVTEATAYRRV